MTKAKKKEDTAGTSVADTSIGKVISVEFMDHAAKLKAEAAKKLAELDAALIANPKLSVRDQLRFLTTSRDGGLFANPYLLEEVPGWNRRDMTAQENKDHVRKLGLSMATKIRGTENSRGVTDAVGFVFRDNRIKITSGHCRRAASLFSLESLDANFSDVPLLAEAKDTSDYEVALGQHTRNTGKEFNPIEKGAHYLYLRETFGKSDAEIAEDIGMTATHVGQCIGYHNTFSSNEGIMALIRSGYVSVAFAVSVVAGQDGGDMDAALEVLCGAVEIAKAEGAPKAMPKHADRFVAEHAAKNPELYETGAAETGNGADSVSGGGDEATGVAEGAAEGAGEDTADVGTGTGAGSRGAKKRATEATTAKKPDATAPVGTVVSPEPSSAYTRKDEITDNWAAICDRKKKAIMALLSDPEKTAFERFLKSCLQGIVE
jgi:hypothetical protein